MPVAAMILGILGGFFGLMIGLFGYTVGGIAGAGGAANAGMFQAVSMAIPIAGLVGGGMAKASPQIAGGLMLISAIGMFAIFGFNFFTAIPLILTALGGVLAFASAGQKGSASEQT